MSGHRFGLPWGRPSLGARWAARFQLILERVRRKPQRPHRSVTTNKEQNFLEIRLLCRNLRIKAGGAACCASSVKHFKAKSLGAGVVQASPPPQLRLAPAKFGADRFFRIKEQIIKRVKISLKNCVM